jgi:hypothetical protein
MTRSMMQSTLGAIGLLVGLAACSGEDDPATDMAAGPGSTSAPGATNNGSSSSGTAAAGAEAVSAGVANYGRPLGMPIGQGASGNEGPPAATPEDPAAMAEEGAGSNGDIEIPVFTPMDAAPPCTGCVELNVDVNDINQRDNFVFAPGGVNVTRVVWTIIVPFNSDQLFVQPFVDSAYGAFTDLDANAFTINTPFQLVHEYSGTASTVGLAVGSSGAWTGNMTMSVFVDSVTLEGADASASRTFDADVGGLVVGSNTHNPKIVYHP